MKIFRLQFLLKTHSLYKHRKLEIYFKHIVIYLSMNLFKIKIKGITIGDNALKGYLYSNIYNNCKIILAYVTRL